MVKPIVLRSRSLVRWLERFAESMHAAQFRTGISLYRNNRIWDYHSSGKSLRASVEGSELTFAQVSVRWDYPFDDQGDFLSDLPDPALELHMHCSCRKSVPCEHIAAAVIYWIIDLDRKARDKSPSLAVAEHTETAYYQGMLTELNRAAEDRSPAYTRFLVSSLKMRPDLQQKTDAITHHVMERLRTRKDDG